VPRITRAAIYCRISKDDEGKAAGVKRQEKDCRALAVSKGWTVGHVLTDNDRSAYNGKARPAYDQLLDGLAGGRYDAVVAWKLDRLTRTGIRGLTPLLNALDGRPLACVHDAIDTSTAMGEGIAGMLASMAKQESANTGTRVRSHKAERANEGRPSGGARAFGYEPDGMTVREPEARAYRKAAHDVLAGKSLAAVCREWNDAGLRTPQRNRLWSRTTARWTLTNPRHAGLRVYQGEVVGPAAWPAIIDQATHEALVAVLSTNGDPAPRRRSLLTGLVRCACGGPMERDGRSWRCRVSYRHPDACGHVSVKADSLETLVEEMVVDLLDSPKLADAMANEDREHEDDAALALATAEAKLAELDVMLGAGELNRASYLRARKEPERKLEDARRRLAHTNGRHALEPFRAGEHPRDLYAGLDMDERRGVISALLDRIIVHPARNRAPSFDADRVEPIWKA
jgi:DNA invertase Pin-like site-specific DNA recombinase